MSDRRISNEPQPDAGVGQLFERLHWSAPPAPFAPAEAVRRRARQRTRRQAGVAGAAAAVAVLAVGGVGVGALDTVRGPGPVGADIVAEASPSPTGVPDGWLLTGADLGPQWRPTTHELFESEPAWFWSGFCSEPPAGGFPSLSGRLDLAVASWQDDSTPESRRVDHVVELFQSAAVAASNLRDIKLVTESCPAPFPPEDGAAPVRLEIVDSGFAGDESLLIEERSHFYGSDGLAVVPHTRPVTVVRVGATVSTVVYEGGQDVRDVARLAVSLVE